MSTLRNIGTSIRLTLGKLPMRKQECFYFEDDTKNEILPVAYVPNDRLEETKRLWELLLTGIPYRERRRE